MNTKTEVSLYHREKKELALLKRRLEMDDYGHEDEQEAVGEAIRVIEKYEALTRPDELWYSDERMEEVLKDALRKACKETHLTPVGIEIESDDSGFVTLRLKNIQQVEFLANFFGHVAILSQDLGD